MKRANRRRLKSQRNQNKKEKRNGKPGAVLASYRSGSREEDAVEVFESAFKVYAETNSPEAVSLAFQAAWKMPEPDVAAELFSRIAKLTPNNADIQNDFGALLCRANQYEEAEVAFRNSLNVTPNDGEVLFNIGQALMGQERFSEAEEFFRKTIAQQFETPMVFSALGEVLTAQNQRKEALDYFKKAFHQEPSNSHIREKYEKALWDSGIGFSELERFYVANLVNDPKNCQSAMKLACIYAGTDRYTRARAIIDEWLPREENLKIEDQAQLREILSELQCIEGDFKSAIHNNHWRLRRKKPRNRDLVQPEWSGECLKGKSILVFAEQGIGDQIMFMSLLPDLVAICDNILVECERRLVKLFERSFPSVNFLAAENPDRIEIGEHNPDFQIAMGSLGCWLWDDFDKRTKGPYLFADETRKTLLKSRYRQKEGESLIGVSWSSPLGIFPGLKSLDLNDFAPLFEVENSIFVDLQYGDTAEERTKFEALHGVSLLHDEGIDQLKDIDAFSAQVAAMDYVITVSNSVAHLAGALGVPTVVLLSSAPQWKWSGSQIGSVWYSDVHLVQRSFGEPVESHVRKGFDLISKKLSH